MSPNAYNDYVAAKLAAREELSLPVPDPAGQLESEQEAELAATEQAAAIRAADEAESSCQDAAWESENEL